MDGDGGDAAVDDEDRCLSLPDLRRAKMDPRWMSSPSRCLPEVRFLRFLGVLYVVSPIQLHGVKLFEEAVAAPTIRPELYGRKNCSGRIVGRWTLCLPCLLLVLFWYY